MQAPMNGCELLAKQNQSGQKTLDRLRQMFMST